MCFGTTTAFIPSYFYLRDTPLHVTYQPLSQNNLFRSIIYPPGFLTVNKPPDEAQRSESDFLSLNIMFSFQRVTSGTRYCFNMFTTGANGSVSIVSMTAEIEKHEQSDILNFTSTPLSALLPRIKKWTNLNIFQWIHLHLHEILILFLNSSVTFQTYPVFTYLAFA